MRRVFLQMVVSLDGYVAGPGGDQSWIFGSMDDSVRRHIADSLSGSDTQLIGRVSYQEQEPYWPTATDDLAPLINDSEKIVFTRHPEVLGELTWANSRLAAGSPAEEIARLKQLDGKDVYVPGGAGFVQELSAQRLIDEYRLIIPPVVLGGGLPLFRAPLELTLIGSQQFGTGTVASTYVPA